MSESNLAKAELAHQGGDIAKAKGHYELALQEDSDSASALYGLGTIALQENQAELAEQLLSQAARLEPEAADIALNLAVASNRRGNKAGAIEQALRAAQLGRTDLPFSNRVSQLLLRLGQSQAVLALKNQQAQDAANGPGKAQIESQILVARAHGLQGQWDRAVSSLRQLSLAHQKSPEIYRELSIAAARLRDFPLAIESYLRFMQQVESSAQPHVRLADLYFMARDKDGAVEQLAIARELGADDAEYHLLCARLARLNDLSDDAVESCLQAIEKHSDYGAAWALLIDLSSGTDIEPRLQQLDQIMQRSTGGLNNLASLHFAYANGLQSLGNYEPALTHYRRANQIHREDLLSRGIEYKASSSEQQVANTMEHFSDNCVGGNQIAGPVSPIFIVGMPRSGTTLMEKILAQLEGVSAGGEIESLSFASTQYQIDVNNGVKPLPSDMSAEQWQDIARQYFSRAPITSGFLTDKLPHNFNNVGMALALFPNVRILQMRRDPRDVCLSIYSHQFPDGHAYACDFDSLAHAYMLSKRLMDYWAQLAPAQVMDISYEALAQHPEIVGRQAVEFCGFEWTDNCLNFFRTDSASFTFSEQQVRERIHQTRIGRWQLYEPHLEDLQRALQKYKVL